MDFQPDVSITSAAWLETERETEVGEKEERAREGEGGTKREKSEGEEERVRQREIRRDISTVLTGPSIPSLPPSSTQA